MSETPVGQWHVTWASRGRQPLVLDEPARRALVRELVARAGPELVLFALVDDHLHVWLLCDAASRIRVVRTLEFALRAAVAAPLQPAHLEPVVRRPHSEWLLRYLLTQTTHHGLPTHPARWSGGCVADLLGARSLGWRSRLPDALPRHRLRDVHAAVGLPLAPLVPAGDAALADLGVAGLLAASAAAFAAHPALADRRPESVRAFGAAAVLARAAGLSLTDLATRADRARESASRAASRPLSDADARVVRLRVALDQAAVAAAPVATPPGPPPAPSPGSPRA